MKNEIIYKHYPRRRSAGPGRQRQDLQNALDCFFWYIENGGFSVACVQTAANLGCYDLADVIATLF